MRIGAIIMFKQCPLCGNTWKNREAFLADPNLVIIGYQARLEKIKDGLFLFNHTCQTTLAMEVMEFDDLYQGPKYDVSLVDTDECSQFCVDMNNLDACGAECKYAYVRDIIQIIKNWPKMEQHRPVFV